MKLLRIVLILIVLLIGLPFAIGSFISSEWKVEASVVIPAPRLMIHYVVEDPTRWPQWNALCPPAETMKRSGAPRGIGSALVGGTPDAPVRWEIVESDPEKGVTFTRHLGETLLGTGEITYDEAEGGTRVTWCDHGDLGGSPITRLFAPMVRDRLQENCERSMQALKALVPQLRKELEKAREEAKERKETENAEAPEPEKD